MGRDDAEREELAEAIAKIGVPRMAEDCGGNVMLTGYVLVVEWMDDNGGSWLSRIDGPPNATTTWKRDGMLHEALYGSWPDRNDD